MAAFFSFLFFLNQTKKKKKKEAILTFTNTLSTHSNFPPAFRHLSLFTAIDRLASFFSISSNSDSLRISSPFIADTSLDNSSVLRRNSFVSDDMVVSIVSPPPSGSSDKSFVETGTIVNRCPMGKMGATKKSNSQFSNFIFCSKLVRNRNVNVI